MVNPIPNSVKKIWEAWNIRSIVLVSLALQASLILFAPFRKRSRRKGVIFVIWSGYLLADWAANVAVGHISSSQGDSSKREDNDLLLAFWAPFLLLHLGGPDTITAFALEDNELWLRHLLGLVAQLFATVYVFVQTIPGNRLWIPTVLLFVAGIIKYVERTRSLYLASLKTFRESMQEKPNPGSNYAKLMDEYSARKEAKLPILIELTPEPDKNTLKNEFPDPDQNKELDDQLEVVQKAYHYFNIFKGLIVDIIFNFQQRDDSRDFFLERSAKDALRLLEIELNFLYEVLYTKVIVVHSLPGYIFRFLSVSCVIVALGLFISEDKRGLKKFDVGLTYTLLFGAVILDAISFFMLILSDWTVAVNKESRFGKYYFPATIFRKLLQLKEPKWSKLNNEGEPESESALSTLLVFRRWSQSFSTYNLITYCLKSNPKSIYLEGRDYFNPMKVGCKLLHYLSQGGDMIIKFLGARDFLDELRYTSKKQLRWDLWKFIFEEIKEKSGDAEDEETTDLISSARGSYVVKEMEWMSNTSKLNAYIDGVAFDESLLLWHIATELCYVKEEESKRDKIENQYCKFSKWISDYMVYLLVFQPNLMSAVAGIGQRRFGDTCAEAKDFFRRREIEEANKACDSLRRVNTEVEPVAVKGDRSKSVLFDGCILAKELDKLLKEEKWRIISKVWVEILSYAASHCRPETLAQQVSKGGELLTFIWLLMAQFGLGEQFQINQGQPRAKLIVKK